MPYGKMSQAYDLPLHAEAKCLRNYINYFFKKTKVSYYLNNNLLKHNNKLPLKVVKNI